MENDNLLLSKVCVGWTLVCFVMSLHTLMGEYHRDIGWFFLITTVLFMVFSMKHGPYFWGDGGI